MKTKNFNLNELQAAAEILRAGELVAFPTETVYGLGADATSDSACAKIYAAKGRPSDNPFIVHVVDLAAAEKIADVTPIARKIFDAFAPGPITVVMKRRNIICDTAAAGLDTIGVRIPSHPVAQEFLRLCNVPVAAPSANISGRLSPTNADMVLRDMDGRISGIVDSDGVDVGLESTVVSVVDDKIKLLRAGAVSLEQLEELLGTPIEIADEVKDGEVMRSPGQKYQHYMPAVPLFLTEDENFEIDDEKIGVMGLTRQFNNLEEYAKGLYSTMDEMGRGGYVKIIAVLPPNVGIGRAIRNRLLRAAAGKFYKPSDADTDNILFSKGCSVL